MIKYISHYVPDEYRKEYISSPAACMVMEYIANILKDIDKNNFSILSFCISKAKNQLLVKSLIFNTDCKVKILPSFANISIIKRILNLTIIKFFRFIICLNQIKCKDYIVIYHSLTFIRLATFLKKIKKCKIIIEVGEIYGAYSSDKDIIQKEIDFLQCADGYIFQSEILNERINIDHKPYVINHGSYKVAKVVRVKEDSKIHCIYSGTFDEAKKGVYTAIQTAKYLPDNYVMHISGFGNQEQVDNVINLINNNNKNAKCKIIYEGLLNDEQYIKLLSKCDIGLNTQDINAEFSDSCFPSKIIKYLSNGLEVVSGRTRTIEVSSIAKYLYFYNEQTGKSIAQSIMSIKYLNPQRCQNIVETLNQKFQRELHEMICRL
jgi:hypothetical protein